ncbi:MAG: metallophosphoesterase family protein [Oligosphaeraceae bacterium]
MRILYFSDIHLHFQPLELLPDADLVLIGGDFTNFGTPQEFREAIRLVEARFPHFLAVAGNLDPAEADIILEETGHGLPARPLSRNGLAMMGISGSNLCPKATPFQWEDGAMEERLAKLPPLSLDILVTHAPPLDSGADVIPNGLHVGSRAIAYLASQAKPRLHLCGHIHEAAGIFPSPNTTLVNCGAFGEEGRHALIHWDTPDDTPKVTLHACQSPTHDTP